MQILDTSEFAFAVNNRQIQADKHPLCWDQQWP